MSISEMYERHRQMISFAYNGGVGRYDSTTASLAGVPAEELPDDFCEGCRRYLSACVCRASRGLQEEATSLHSGGVEA
jgi:hypothetical protein